MVSGGRPEFGRRRHGPLPRYTRRSAVRRTHDPALTGIGQARCSLPAATGIGKAAHCLFRRTGRARLIARSRYSYQDMDRKPRAWMPPEEHIGPRWGRRPCILPARSRPRLWHIRQDSCRRFFVSFSLRRLCSAPIAHSQCRFHMSPT